MAHESKGEGPSVAELGQQAAAAHEAQHGVAKANENLQSASVTTETTKAEEVEADENAPKAKAQQPAEDKAQAAPKASKD